MSLGQKIRAAREAAELSQAQLGKACSCSQQIIDNLESGKTLNSKYLSAITEYLELTPPRVTETIIPVVGYIGAGAVVWPIDDNELGNGIDEIDAPPGVTSGIALKIRGDSMYPKFDPGDIVVCESKPREMVNLLNKVCYVKLADGRAYLKILRRGSVPGRWSLHSHNAPPIEDVEIDQAYQVVWVKPA